MEHKMSITIYRIRNKRTGGFLPIPRLSQTEAEISAINHAKRTTILAGRYPRIKYSDTEVVSDSVADMDELIAEVMAELGVPECTARVLLADSNL
jgi:hypothetical protein